MMMMRISLSAILLCVSLGCGDDEVCGPGEAAADGVTIEVGGQTITHGDFTSSPNNDCPDPGGGPTSLTIEGKQTSPAGSAVLTLCVPSPDEIGAAPIPLAGDDRIQIIDVGGEIDGCRLFRDPAQPASGTITFFGYCDDGLSPDGYALELSGTVPGRRACPVDAGMTDEPVTLALSGKAAVAAINL